MDIDTWHFNTSNIVVQTNICVGEQVAISGINIVSEVGLNNGTWGKVIDIVYTNSKEPNNKHDYHLT